jgi:phosphocarrier protein HPr
MGLHVRPAERLSSLASSFKADITIKTDNATVSAKSIIELLTLGAGFGTTLVVIANGDDAEQAVEAIDNLVKDKFGME